MGFSEPVSLGGKESGFTREIKNRKEILGQEKPDPGMVSRSAKVTDGKGQVSGSLRWN